MDYYYSLSDPIDQSDAIYNSWEPFNHDDQYQYYNANIVSDSNTNISDEYHINQIVEDENETFITINQKNSVGLIVDDEKLTFLNNHINAETIKFQQFEINSLSDKFILFGRTERGESVCCNVWGFKYYFYIHWINFDISEFNDKFSKTYKAKNERYKYDTNEAIHSVVCEFKKNIVDYSSGVKKFLKITINDHSQLKKIQKLLQQEYGVGNDSFFGADVTPTYRFAVDLKINGFMWIILNNHERVFSDTEKISVCDIECNVHYTNIKTDDDWSVAPFKICSFDIECCGRPNSFPDPKVDEIIQIANVVYTYERPDMPIIKNVFVRNTCDSLDDKTVDVFTFDTEEELLMKWKEFIMKNDPDFFTGYNINNFDFKYLLNRAKHLKQTHFNKFSRLKRKPIDMETVQISSKQMGTKNNMRYTMPGRCIFDVLTLILREYKLRAYTLNFVSNFFLKDSKEDIHYSQISILHNQGPSERKRLATYCFKDAELPMLLLSKLMFLQNYIEMARVAGVSINDLITRGQQIKVMSGLLRNSEGYLFPSPIIRPCVEEDFQGATVLDPVPNYYKDPITTLDFSSLYPSIMIAHNLCYTTLLPSQNNTFSEKSTLR